MFKTSRDAQAKRLGAERDGPSEVADADVDKQICGHHCAGMCSATHNAALDTGGEIGPKNRCDGGVWSFGKNGLARSAEHTRLFAEPLRKHHHDPADCVRACLDLGPITNQSRFS